jgi:hypothetical protein
MSASTKRFRPIEAFDQARPGHYQLLAGRFGDARFLDTDSNWPRRFDLIVVSGGLTDGIPARLPQRPVSRAPDLGYLTADDVITLRPKRGAIRALDRQKITTYSFLVTERCNPFCILYLRPFRVVGDR